MLSILSSHKKIIIGVVVVVLLFIAYAIWAPKSTPATGDLTRQNTTGTTGTSADPNSPDRQFVTQLLAIQNIHFDLTLFSDPAYTYLQDYSRDLTPQEVGRDNPFSPIDGTTSNGTSTAGIDNNFVTGTTPGFINTSAGATSTASTTPAPGPAQRSPLSITSTSTKR